jgi:dihydroorotate dehydrogenase electron transfer subunit
MYMAGAWFKGGREMLPKLSLSCSDINSVYCPCLLAETNHCLACSQLRGEETCDCGWKGVCILYERLWQMKANAGWPEPLTMRQETTSQVLHRELIARDTYLIEFAIESEMAVELEKTGSFVFLRRPEDPQFFHFPVGIMKVKASSAQVVVETVGVKSKRLLEGEPEQISVRGPYYNGVLGQPWIDNLTAGKVLLVAGGMGQAPALPLAARLRAKDNEVLAVLAPGKIGTIFIDKELRELGVTVEPVDSMRLNGVREMKQRFCDSGRPDLVVSAGPDEQHFGVIAAMQAAGVDLPLAATNNATMCCGEGICGSCEVLTSENRRVRVCKAQAGFSQVSINEQQ